MKLFTPARFAALCLAALACTGAHADSQQITVTANVSGVCKLTAYPNMTFTLDPTSNADGSASSAIQYKCTKGTAPATFSVGGATGGTYNATGANALGGSTGNTDTIPYQITWTTPTAQGTGFGTGSTATTVNLTGTILNANYVNVRADSYTKQVTVAITP